MASCEYCWSRSRSPFGPTYEQQLRIAEANGAPCTKPGIEGDRLRAGEYWDEERQIDTRTVTSAAAVPTPEET